jgi:thiamine kinase-like enzyme
MTEDRIQKIVDLPCWEGRVEPQPLEGGITNFNFTVHDQGKKYLVRLGEDIIQHQIMRFNEVSASRAAYEAGIAPEVIFSGQGALVLSFIDGKTLSKEDIQKRQVLDRVIPVLRECHTRIKDYLRGPVLAFWVFHVIRDYAHTLESGQSRKMQELPRLLKAAEELEKAVSTITLVFGHNDLLPENFIDDGNRLWLVDWEYAGFNSPLFDLGGVASNCELSLEDEEHLLENYYQTPVTDELRYRYKAMKCASLLREAMWSMVSELYSQIDFDYEAYTESNLAHFEAQFKDFQRMR